MIRIKNLYKSFDSNRVLRGINLELEEGQTLTIIGKSGCGKTVLLKQMIGLLKPDEGEIEIRIADNGLGVPTNFDFRKVNSLGLQIITLLTENQLRGKVEMISDKGLEFRIRFKEVYRAKRI